jgi:hypothetical protein
MGCVGFEAFLHGSFAFPVRYYLSVGASLVGFFLLQVFSFRP